MPYSVNVGDTVPAFKAKDSEGNEITDEDLIGKPTVIYFYPMDNTPGCTKEACSFRDNMAKLNEMEVRVIGVSPDNAESHKKFKEKYHINYSLITDENLSVSKKFNVPKGILGLERTTFLIDSEGIIRWIERPVSVSGHVDRILEALKQI